MNTEVFRLTEFANRLDLPSVTLPGRLTDTRAHRADADRPAGGDAAMLDLAALIETVSRRAATD